MNYTVTVGNVDIGPKAKKYVNDVLDTNRLAYGKYSKYFEQKFAELHDCKYAVLSNSGTSSLQVALATLKEVHGWPDGSEVIVPATTFVASVNVIIQNNLKPILVDVDPIYYEIDPTLIEQAITERTKCIMVVHLFGQPCDMDPIMKIAQSHNLRIVEDSCETMFARYNGKSVGTFGDIACFSTYSAHIIVTGVGGLSVTNNEQYAVIMRSLVNHGRNNIYISIDDSKTGDQKLKSEIIEKRFQFVRVGYSYRITELEAALGVAQLEDYLDNIHRRKEIAKKYTTDLTKFSQFIQLPQIRSNCDHVFMMYPIVIKSDSTVTKRKLVEHLESKGIETRDMLPLVNQPIYQHMIEGQTFDVSTMIVNNGFFIGSHPGVSDDQINYVVNVLIEFFQGL